MKYKKNILTSIILLISIIFSLTIETSSMPYGIDITRSIPLIFISITIVINKNISLRIISMLCILFLILCASYDLFISFKYLSTKYEYMLFHTIGNIYTNTAYIFTKDLLNTNYIHQKYEHVYSYLPVIGYFLTFISVVLYTYATISNSIKIRLLSISVGIIIFLLSYNIFQKDYNNFENIYKLQFEYFKNSIHFQNSSKP